MWFSTCSSSWPAILATLIAFPLIVSASPYPPAALHTKPCHESALQQGSFGFFNRLRDSIVNVIWRSPPASSYHSKLPSTDKSASQNLRERYGGDVVLRFNISSEKEARALADATYVLFLDVWEFTAEWADIRLAKDTVPSLLGLLPDTMQHAHTPLMHDLAQTIYDSFPSPAVAGPPPLADESHRTFGPTLSPPKDETNIFFSDYQPLSVIVPWMRLLQSLFPTHVRIIKVGTSYEGRDILALRVGVHPSNSEQPSSQRKSIIVSGGIHAREWISAATVNYAAYTLITSYGKSRDMTKLMEEFDWVFIPTLNPDGYAYTWESDRLWRKNRQETSIRFCKGLDLDRTFGYQWDGQSTKGNPCSESFSGDMPFQALESLRFANWAKNETLNNNYTFVGFLDLHSYSQQVLYPFSYSCIDTPPTLENLEELGLGLAKAIHQTTGELYGVTSACEGSVAADQKGKDHRDWPRIEASGGSALDWMYHEIGIRYSYQLKLRDTGNYGFLLPSKNIVPTGREVFSAITYFGNYMLSNHGIEKVGSSPSSEEVKMSAPNFDDLGLENGYDADSQKSSSGIEEKSSWELRRR